MQHVVIGLCATDARRLHPHGGREIGSAKAHGLQAGAGGGDGFDMGDAGGGFDDHLEGDGGLAACGAFDGCHEGIDRIDILGAADLGNHDLVQTLAALFQQIDHGAIPPWCVQTVDPDRQVFGAPVHVIERRDDISARAVLVGGGHRILEVDVDHIRRTGRHLLEDRGARAGAEQLATVRTGGGSRLDAKAPRLGPFG